MASIKEKNLSEDETSFNISEIDSKIFKNDEFSKNQLIRKEYLSK